MITQKQRIIDYINKFGSITTLDAFMDLGITRLSARIAEMEQDGIVLNRAWESNKNRFGETVRYVRYSFPEKQQ